MGLPTGTFSALLRHDRDRAAAMALTVPPLNMDLRTVSDEAAAEKLADVMFTALRGRWHEG